MDDSWETEIGALLTELADVQGALLGVLSEKRQMLASGDHESLGALAGREQQLLDRLQACHEQRQQLLARAGAEGLPADSIRTLSNHLPGESRGQVQAAIREAADRSRLLQHQSLTNWVLVQRSLLHLSQMIEIIATGGRPKPTYGKGSERRALAGRWWIGPRSSLLRWRMGLFGAIQMGGNTLRAMQIGLQVVGNNIANANTPGYVRQDTIYVPAPVQRQGSLIIGTGVLVDSIVQKLDRFVQDRLVGARSDRAGAEVQEEVYRDLEVLLNELASETDLSGALTGFFNAVDDVLKDPGSIATRNLAVEKGAALAANINSLHGRAFSLQQEMDQRVSAMAGEINRLAEEIRVLNIQISSTEGGDTSSSKAAGLRVMRQTAVDRLSELVGISAYEQPSGGLAVAIGGEFLVFEGQRREVAFAGAVTSGLSNGVIEFTDTRAAITATSGELLGLYAARDEILVSFFNRLDELAGTLAFEFNRVYSQGQGLVGFSQLTSVETIHDPTAALDAAGLAFTPVSGAFNILIHSKESNLTRTHTIAVDLDGIDQDTTLASLTAQLDALDGLSATITATGALQLAVETSDLEFAFAPALIGSSGDTSGVLAALGLNTFFTGSTASTIDVNAEVKGIGNAAKFAASLGGIGEDSGNAERLAAFFEQPLESAGNASIGDLYDQLLNEVTQGSSIAQSLAEGFRIFEGTLEGQQQAVSGVSLDEEAIKMITLQRIYQASARYIQTVSELLDLLVNM